MGNITNDKLLSVSRFWGLDLELIGDNTYPLTFLLTHTVETPLPLIQSVVYQFTHGVNCAATGTPCVPEILAAWEAPEYKQDQTRVIISHADIPVWQGDDKPPLFYSVNRFTEWYDASDLVREITFGANDVVKAMADMGFKPSERRSPARNGGNDRNTQAAPEPAAMAKIDDGLQFFPDCPTKAFLRENLAGQKFRTAITKIDVGLEDGQRKYTLYSSWEGMTSQYSFASTNGNFLRDVPTQIYLRGLQPGSQPVMLTGVFYVNVKDELKKMPNGEMQYPTYVNLNRLDFSPAKLRELIEGAEINQVMPDDVPDFNPDFIPPPRDPDDIPF